MWSEGLLGSECGWVAETWTEAGLVLCLGAAGCPSNGTMLRLISRALAVFRRKIDSSEAEREQHMRLLELEGI